MKTRHQFVVSCILSHQILVVALLISSVKSFFPDKNSLSTKWNIGNSNNSTHERKIRSSTKNLRKDTTMMRSYSEIEVNERTSKEHQKNDTSHGIDEGDGLVFEGKFNYQSDIVSIPTAVMSSPATDLFEFFSDKKNRDFLIKGGGNPCKSIPSTPKLYDEWTIQSKIVKSTPPNGSNNNKNKNNDDGRNEEILAVYSEVPIVPGLSLRAVSVTGCKTMKESTSALPYYEFTLLEESYQPVGKTAMTWIFDKVTGNKKDKTHGIHATTETESRKGHSTSASNSKCSSSSSSSSRSRKTYALSRVMLKPCPQDGGLKICYYGHVKLTLSKKFLHMLPLPTRMVQAKVNRSIRKQLERECTRSIEKFTGALKRWNEMNERGVIASAGT